MYLGSAREREISTRVCPSASHVTPDSRPRSAISNSSSRGIGVPYSQRSCTRAQTEVVVGRMSDRRRLRGREQEGKRRVRGRREPSVNPHCASRGIHHCRALVSSPTSLPCHGNLRVRSVSHWNFSEFVDFRESHVEEDIGRAKIEYRVEVW